MNKFPSSEHIKSLGTDLGFQQVGITTTSLEEDEKHLVNWLKQGRHGEMSYMRRHGNKRSRPNELVPGTISVISVRMDYLPPSSKHPMQVLNNNELGYVSRYAM